MENFKHYIIEEYKHKLQNGYAAVNFKFTHTSNTRMDKKSGKTLINNIIKVNIKFIDNECNTLLTDTLTFENNVLSKACANKLQHISPKELNTRFGCAQTDIINTITNEYQHKSSELAKRINTINIYKGYENGVIPSEFKGESVMLCEMQNNTVPITKPIFDM